VGSDRWGQQQECRQHSNLGSNWSGLNNTALGGTQTTGAQTTGAQAGNPVHSPSRPALPPQPSVAGATKASLVLSNASPIVFSGQDKYGNFLFQKNSAGLGVPKGSVGNLNKISNHVERRGSASMPVHITTAGEMNVSGHQGSGVLQRPTTLPRKISQAFCTRPVSDRPTENVKHPFSLQNKIANFRAPLLTVLGN